MIATKTFDEINTINKLFDIPYSTAILICDSTRKIFYLDVFTLEINPFYTTSLPCSI